MTTTTSSPATLSPDELYEAWLQADRVWSALVKGLFPSEDPHAFRYTNAGKGEPGSPLRAAYDEFCRTGSAWHEAKDVELVLIDY